MESLVGGELLYSVYKGKKIFVTGHTGFKGTWLIAMLRHLGAHVMGYALPPTDSKPFHDLFSHYELSKTIIADIRDRTALAGAIQSFEPDFIFHLAAQPLVLRSYDVPAETFEVNVVGTANVLESLRSLTVPCITVVVTTDKVYENKENHTFFKESDRLGGHDPYSASKACTELVVKSFRDSFFHPSRFRSHGKCIATARAGNVIGGGDYSENRIIPDTVKALLNHQPVIVRNPNAVRPWQHVLESIGGYLLLGAKMKENAEPYCDAFNFGPLEVDHLRVEELVNLVLTAWGGGRMELSSGDKSYHEAGLLKLDTNKARKELGWRPRLNAEEAVKWTIDWYKKDESQKADFTFEQINNYLLK